MQWRSNITAWKDPITNEFISRTEYQILAKQTEKQKVSIPEYLISKGYYKDQYNYYRRKEVDNK